MLACRRAAGWAALGRPEAAGSPDPDRLDPDWLDPDWLNPDWPNPEE